MADSFFTQRRSLDRESSKLKRASRRLAKKGFRAEAGKLMAASEMAKMQEPTIMRPEFRELEQAGRDIQALQAQATGELDFDRDIAPLRGEFFNAVQAANLSDSEKNILTDKFAPQFTKAGLDQLDIEGKQTANQMAKLSFEGAKMQQEKMRKEFEVNKEAQAQLGNITRELEIATSGGTDSEKEDKVFEIARKYGSFLSNPNVAKAIELPLTQIANKRQADQSKIRSSLAVLSAGQGLGSLPEEERANVINKLGFSAEDSRLLNTAAKSAYLEQRNAISVNQARADAALVQDKIRSLNTIRTSLASYEEFFEEGEKGSFGMADTTTFTADFIADKLRPHINRLFPARGRGANTSEALTTDLEKALAMKDEKSRKAALQKIFGIVTNRVEELTDNYSGISRDLPEVQQQAKRKSVFGSDKD